MKLTTLLFGMLIVCSTLSAQKNDYYTYTVSGGLLGALNFDKFRVADDDPDITYNVQTNLAGGIWVNIPLSHRLSVEPQVMYSVYDYKSTGFENLLRNGSVGYLSVPVELKYDLCPTFALTLGPQFDFAMNVEDNLSETTNDDDITGTSIAANVGFELFPHGRLTLFGRYMHGFSNMDNRDVEVDESYYNQNFQAGVKVRLFGKAVPKDTDGDGITDDVDACINTPGVERYQGCPIPDTDGDGINDEEDECINEKGLARYDGCPIPDTDGDGLNDEEDKCPNVAGLARLDGCPIPDTDGDGINDEEDKCPNEAGIARLNGCPERDADNDGVLDADDKCPDVKGLARYDGCPIPDTDGDGINDEEDKCPKIKGIARMKGCPDVEYSPHAVTFASGSSTLTGAGKRELDRLHEYMQTHPDVKIKLIGYTDSTGSDAVNMPLSERRAESSKAYLVGKGISGSRISTSGMGPANPVADNSTADGRSKNRRIEMEIH